MKKRVLIRSLIGGAISTAILATGCASRPQDLELEKLVYAVTCNNLQGVEEVLESGKDVDLSNSDTLVGWYEGWTYFGEDNHTPLAIALTSNYTDSKVTEALIRSGAPLDNCGEEYTYLNHAICNEPYEVCKALVECGAPVNGGKETPLGSLFCFASPDMADLEERARLLVRAGARIDKRAMKACLENRWKYLYADKVLSWLERQGEETGLEPELEAAIRGDDRTLRRLVKEGRIKDKKEVLMFAAAYCDSETLRQMERAGYNFSIVDETSGSGMDLLQIASLRNGEESVRFLLEKGLDGTQMSEAEYQAITYAAIGGNERTLRLLLEQGYTYQRIGVEPYEDEQYDQDSLDENEDDGELISTWEEACRLGSAASVKILLKLGYEPTEEERRCGYLTYHDGVFNELLKQEIPYGKDYLKWLADVGSFTNLEEHVKTLLDQGADVSPETLRAAAECRDRDLVKTMLEKGAAGTPEEGESPLETAVSIGDFEIVKLLVEAGADVNQETTLDGVPSTLMHIAAESASADVLKYLIEKGGKVDGKDGEGRRPYDYAKEVKLEENMKLLREH